VPIKLIEVELFDYITNEFKLIKAIVDTGASQCSLSSKIAREFGIEIRGDTTHHWHATGPLIGTQVDIKLRYREKEHTVRANCIKIDSKYLRHITPGEECTRPADPHPLGFMLLLGWNFLDSIPREDKTELIGMLFE
jgi:hypothetical protein